MIAIQIFINGIEVGALAGQEIIVRERDYVRFRVRMPIDTDRPLLLVEDFSVVLSQVMVVDEEVVFESVEGPVFREVFGNAVCRFESGDFSHMQLFNVLLRKIDTREIEAMISYLFSRSASLIRVCLARSTVPVGTSAMNEADPEALLKAAESYTARLSERRAELSYHMRTRLIPVKSPEWESHQGNRVVDPYDVLMNLDILAPVIGEGDVFLQGRHFSIQGMDTASLHPSGDVEENSILIGGLYSIRRKVQELLTMLDSGKTPQHLDGFDKEHESLGNLLARVTTGTMCLRCEEILETVEELLRYFESKLDFIYRGEIAPRITPFVRASRVYRPLFSVLHEWYEIGSPSDSGRHLLLKLRTVSKIYEFFCLYKTIEFLHGNNWIVSNFVPKPDSNECIPATMVFEKSGISITLRYDIGVEPMNINSEHLSLVDLKNRLQDPSTWYAPDFVLRVQFLGEVRYLVLDAKYSNLAKVREERLPDILNKYYLNTGVYDQRQQIVSSDRILSVIAIFPSGSNTNGVFPKWSTVGNGIFGQIPRFPLAGGVTLSSEDESHFGRLLQRLIDVSVNAMKTAA